MHSTKQRWWPKFSSFTMRSKGVMTAKHFAKIPKYIFTFIPLLILGFLEVRDSRNQYWWNYCPHKQSGTRGHPKSTPWPNFIERGKNCASWALCIPKHPGMARNFPRPHPGWLQTAGKLLLISPNQGPVQGRPWPVYLVHLPRLAGDNPVNTRLSLSSVMTQTLLATCTLFL